MAYEIYKKKDTSGNIEKIEIADSSLSSTSTNPIQNKVVTDALTNKANKSDLGITYIPSPSDKNLIIKLWELDIGNYITGVRTDNSTNTQIFYKTDSSIYVDNGALITITLSGFNYKDFSILSTTGFYSGEVNASGSTGSISYYSGVAISQSDNKSYITGSESLNTPVNSNVNTKVYMKSGELYSNNKKVLNTDYVAPVTSVNGQTGAVTISVPTKTSDLTNDSGYITSGLSKSDLLTFVYPINSIYMSVSNTSPASFLGGTWTQLTGRFLLGAGTTSGTSTSYTNGTTGGESSHILTTSEIPSHNHKGIYWQGNTGSSYNATLDSGGGRVKFTHGWTGGGSESFYTGTTGSGTAHNNMPPYLVVYMWKRTA